MDFPEFVQAVVTRTGLSREEAADLSRATVELLGHMLSSGEARDFSVELPEELAGYVREGVKRQERIPLYEAVRRIQERVGLSEPESDRGIRAVLATLREAAGEEEFSNAMSQIGHEYLQVIS
ncbi:Uncharacterized conserved protein, DUF2267 family [Streptomyces sp. DvalAA-14]|uniref:DUF2267 domain-containing protein n=1 Tax=unclassified Streptomyces TaxID=2593676 RepID=UPI00081B6B88|nr:MULTISPECIES: DUF2267 domain-containing protein [unclassified Streptomyces]MYS23910.1 DUF2267 domain-containing protein [Streptomyces sp. SID4948]SCE40301.1 Uncharacterized conserved protein, DUF2267 family [Streptomyces sp. DvalAA-14]